MVIGETIRQLRELRKMSRAAFAQRTGVSVHTLEDVESGVNPTAKTLERIAAGLNVDIGDLFKSPPITTPDEAVGFRAMTLDEAASTLQCTKSNILYLIQGGQLRSEKFGPRRFVDADTVENYRRVRRGDQQRKQGSVNQQRPAS
jgi:excisionase family DNA binding protein